MALVASNCNLLIAGGSFNRVVEGSSRDFDILAQRVATQARHDSGELSDPAKCHPDTRVAILTDLEEWAGGATYSSPIKWITGSAGVGKTAISRSFAEILEKRNLLLADFFFWRTGDRCNTTEFFIPTLAYQIAISLPETRPFIESAIRHDPHIFTRTLEVQSQALIIGPITSIFQKNETLRVDYPRIFVIDGLDECLDAEKQSQDVQKQTEVLHVLYWTLDQLPAPFALLIASRPEYHIRRTFDTLLKGSSSSVMLNDSYDADADIRRFYQDKFLEIQQHHPLRSYLPSSQWPSVDVVDDLVRRASGQFIYASTVARFVAASKKNPSNQLNLILHANISGNSRPFQSLDFLYSVIFMAIDKDDLPATLRVLGILLLGRSRTTRTSRYFSPDSLPPGFWDRFLGFQPGEVQRLMLGLESVLSIQGLERKYFRFYHASLQDFLFDSSRSGTYFIEAEVIYEDLAKRSIYHLSTSDDDIETYILFGMQYWFTYAKPSKGLRLSIEQSQLLVHPRHLKLRFPIFLGVIKQLAEKVELYKQKQNIYLSQLVSVISLYLKHEPLTFLLLATIGGGATAAGIMDRVIGMVYPLPAELLQLDKKEGFCLYEDHALRTFLWTDIEYILDFNLFTETVEKIILESSEAGELYAAAAAALVRSFGRASRPSPSDVEAVACDILKHVLQKASSQSGLAEYMRDNLVSQKFASIQFIIEVYYRRVDDQRRSDVKERASEKFSNLLKRLARVGGTNALRGTRHRTHSATEERWFKLSSLQLRS